MGRKIEAKQRLEVSPGRENREAEFGATKVAGIWVTKHQRGGICRDGFPKSLQKYYLFFWANSLAAHVWTVSLAKA